MTQSIRHGSPRLLAIAMLAGAILAGAGGLATPGRAQPVPDGPVLRVTGEGRVEMAPDMAMITLGVESRAKTARAALSENSRRVAATLDTLRAAGIAARDMQTSGLSLGPEWETYRPGGENRPRVIGFVATNMVTIRVRDLPALGGILDKIADDGANVSNGLQFSVSNMDELRDTARRAAVQDARRKADLYAAAAGVTLGPIQSLTEGATGAVPRPMMAREMALSDAPVPVAEGEITVSATVEIVYALSQ